MGNITYTNSSPFHDVERRIYNLVMKHEVGYDWMQKWKHGQADIGGAKVATEMVKVFAQVQEAYVFDKLSKGALIEWLMQIEPTPIELSEIIEEIEANKVLTYDIKKRKIVRGTGE